jgi:hypothetical protein
LRVAFSFYVLFASIGDLNVCKAIAADTVLAIYNFSIFLIAGIPKNIEAQLTIVRGTNVAAQ